MVCGRICDCDDADWRGCFAGYAARGELFAEYDIFQGCDGHYKTPSIQVRRQSQNKKIGIHRKEDVMVLPTLAVLGYQPLKAPPAGELRLRHTGRTVRP